MRKGRERGGDEEAAESEPPATPRVLYGVNDVPPWYITAVLGMQQLLTCSGGLIVLPLVISSILMVDEDDEGISIIMSNVLFVNGVCTIIQSLFGVRLPIVQGGSFAYLIPSLAIVASANKDCNTDFSSTTQPNGNLSAHFVSSNASILGDSASCPTWRENMATLQGCLAVAAILEMLLGFSGAISWLMNYIGPLTIAPTTTLIGLSLFKVAANEYAAAHWWIAISAMVLIAIFSQILSNINCKIYSPTCTDPKRCADPSMRRVGKIKIFGLFPVILAIVITWIICLILTAANALPNTPDQWGYSARTDTRIDILHAAPWARFPYPGEFGLPRPTIAGVIGMAAASLASIVESIGDYSACARLSGVPPPPKHAVNRGIMCEGIGCIFAGLMGAPAGSTSYSENIGSIGITKVASRVVTVVCGFYLIFLGIFIKFGAIFMTIPLPIIGGSFFIMFGLITAVGISNLQFVDMNSSRNLFVFGVSLFAGLCIPTWVTDVAQNDGSINTGVGAIDDIIIILLSTNMFVGGAIGFLLDNLLPGTKKERGFLSTTVATSEEDRKLIDECYTFNCKLPNALTYLFICPPDDKNCCCCSCCEDRGNRSVEEIVEVPPSRNPVTEAAKPRTHVGSVNPAFIGAAAPDQRSIRSDSKAESFRSLPTLADCDVDSIVVTQTWLI